MGTDVSYLKQKMNYSKTEKILTMENTPSTDTPCLENRVVTRENFVEKPCIGLPFVPNLFEGFLIKKWPHGGSSQSVA